MWCYTLLPKILNMSLTAGIAIVLVLLARLMLRKAPKIFSYALWAVVLFRLVCPLSFSSEFSLLGLFNTPTATVSDSGTYSSITYIPSDIVHMEYPRVDLPLPGVSKAINENLPQGREQIAADPLEFPMSSATTLWLFGIAAMLIYSVISILRLRSKLVGAVKWRDNIYLADHIASPFVMGALRPKIYLPSTLSERERDYIVLHEQTHIRRFDHIVKIIAFFTLTVHWFNPLVWAAFFLCVKDMEMSCDEAVMRKMNGDIRVDYSTSLLSLAAGRKIVAGTPLAFGEGDTKSRIKNVMNYKKPAFWIVAVAMVVCIVLAVCLITNPRTDPSEWQSQPVYEDQDDYFAALEAARTSDRTEEIAAKDMGDNEKTALAWMDAWFDMYKALPKDNIAYISDGVVDRLYIVKISKEGLPKAFVFSVIFSVRPTYPIAQGGFWAAGNTTESSGRDETWGQQHIEVELRLENDGNYHYVSSGTGAVGSLDTYDILSAEGTANEEYNTSLGAAEQAQAVLDSIVSDGTVAMTLTIADGIGGGRYEVPLEYGNGRNRVSGFDSSFDWSYMEGEPSSKSVNSLKVESPDGAASIQCWQDSDLVFCTLDSKSFWLSAGVLGSDAVFDGTIFTYLRIWYDEAEISGLRGNIVVPDKGQSYQEIAQAWTEAEEEAMLRATPGSKYACTYVKITASINKDAVDSWYSMEALKTEHFYFNYSTVFIPENDRAKNWLMAGNTVEYTGSDAPAGALKYYLMGPMYLTEEGWRCGGVGTGP